MDGYLNAVRVAFIIRIHTQVPAIKPVIFLTAVLVFSPSWCCSLDSNIQVCCLYLLQVTSKETETREKRQQIQQPSAKHHTFTLVLLRIKTFGQLWKNRPTTLRWFKSIISYCCCVVDYFLTFYLLKQFKCHMFASSFVWSAIVDRVYFSLYPE